MDPLTLTITGLVDAEALLNVLAPLVADWKAGRDVSLDEVRAAAQAAGLDIATLDQVIAAAPDEPAPKP
ncbi:MAG TPA: hypothetical protein VGM15_03160 [Burkholderiaceae bacterium]|jgi:hypothetical protein